MAVAPSRTGRPSRAPLGRLDSVKDDVRDLGRLIPLPRLAQQRGTLLGSADGLGLGLRGVSPVQGENPPPAARGPLGEGPPGGSWWPPLTLAGGLPGTPRKGQKMPFFWGVQCKVQGEWGGSAHSPDPTAQSATRAPASPLPVADVRGGVRWVGCGGCLGGCAPLCCVTQCSDWDGRKGREEREVLAGAKTYFRGGTPRCSGSPARTCGTTRNPCPTRRPSKRGSSVLEMLSHLSASPRFDDRYV